VSPDNSEIKMVDIRNHESSEEKIEQRSIRLEKHGIAGDIRVIMKACQPEQLMRGSPDCSLKHSTLKMLCNRLQVTTNNNETLVFDID